MLSAEHSPPGPKAGEGARTPEEKETLKLFNFREVQNTPVPAREIEGGPSWGIMHHLLQGSRRVGLVVEP